MSKEEAVPIYCSKCEQLVGLLANGRLEGNYKLFCPKCAEEEKGNYEIQLWNNMEGMMKMMGIGKGD